MKRHLRVNHWFYVATFLFWSAVLVSVGLSEASSIREVVVIVLFMIALAAGSTMVAALFINYVVRPMFPGRE